MSLKVDMKSDDMTKLYQQMKRTLDTVNEGYRIKVGVLYPEPYDARPEVDVVQVATWQNFGTTGQRPIDKRPFMSYSALFIQRSRNIQKIIKRNQELHFSIDKDTAYLLGEYASTIIKQTIRKRQLYRPLAESTIKKKGHDRPLRETNLLIHSIDYSIHKARQSRRTDRVSGKKTRPNRRRGLIG